MSAMAAASALKSAGGASSAAKLSPSLAASADMRVACGRAGAPPLSAPNAHDGVGGQAGQEPRCPTALFQSAA